MHSYLVSRLHTRSAPWELCPSQSGSCHRPSALQGARSALAIHPTREECLLGYSALFPCLICKTRAPVGLCVIVTNISSLGAVVLKGTLLKSILADGPRHVMFTVYIFLLHNEYSTSHSARSCPDDVTSQVCKGCKGVSHDVRTWVRGSKTRSIGNTGPLNRLRFMKWGEAFLFKLKPVQWVVCGLHSLIKV